MAARASDILDPEREGTLLFGYWRPTSAWISANLFRLTDAGVAASVLRAGDAKRGAVLIVMAQEQGGGRVLGHMRSAAGNSLWLPVHRADWLDASAVDAAIRRALDRDPDLWVLRIDARSHAARTGQEAPPPACPVRDGADDRTAAQKD